MRFHANVREQRELEGLVAACAAGVVGANSLFGILDNTGDELADPRAAVVGRDFVGRVALELRQRGLARSGSGQR